MLDPRRRYAGKPQAAEEVVEGPVLQHEHDHMVGPRPHLVERPFRHVAPSPLLPTRVGSTPQVRAKGATAVAMLVRVARGAALEDRGSSPLNIKVDVGRTLALLLFGLLFGVAALWLFLDDEPVAAATATFVGFTSAILSGGFGLALGEKTGAAEADRVARGGA